MKRVKNLVGRLEAAWDGAWQAIGTVEGYGLLKSTVFDRASLVL